METTTNSFGQTFFFLTGNKNGKTTLQMYLNLYHILNENCDITMLIILQEAISKATY